MVELQNKQVNRSYYNLKKYYDLARWSSYYYQIDEVLCVEPESVLEIGAGNKTLECYIESNTDIEYKSLDIAQDLQPDIIGSIDAIPLSDRSFDVVCAFEVLEHLPFDKFERSLSEIDRVAKKYAIISLPHFGPPIKINFKFPFLKEVKCHFKIPYPRKHEFNGQHYWEIGKRGYSPKKIRGILSKYFKIEKEFVPYENQYHRFYVLRKHY